LSSVPGSAVVWRTRRRPCCLRSPPTSWSSFGQAFRRNQSDPSSYSGHDDPTTHSWFARCCRHPFGFGPRVCAATPAHPESAGGRRMRGPPSRRRRVSPRFRWLRRSERERLRLHGGTRARLPRHARPVRPDPADRNRRMPDSGACARARTCLARLSRAQRSAITRDGKCLLAPRGLPCCAAASYRRGSGLRCTSRLPASYRRAPCASPQALLRSAGA
jgi:hypothetical protein